MVTQREKEKTSVNDGNPVVKTALTMPSPQDNDGDLAETHQSVSASSNKRLERGNRHNVQELVVNVMLLLDKLLVQFANVLVVIVRVTV